MSLPSKLAISSDEETSLFLHLMSPQEHVQRLGLIKICELLQSGRFFQTNSVHHAARGFLFGFAEETERWALKALVEFRDPADFELVKSKLQAEPASFENLSWTVAAFFATANERQIEEAFATKLISPDGLALLANNFARAPRRAELAEVAIDIDKAHPLELKWGCLCFATGRVRDGIFIPRFSQIGQLAALNLHHEEEVAQYSLYAMVRQKRDTKEMTIPLHEIGKKPESVRKWSYRLVTRDGTAASEHIDFIQEVARHEKGTRAQEGLALGLAGTWIDGLEGVVVDWYARRPEERVQEALLSHMARHSEKASFYSEIVLDTFSTSPANGLRRSQLLANAAGTKLYGDLQRVAYQDNASPDMFSGFGSNNGGLQVKGNNNIIITGQNNQAAGLATGRGTASADRATQTIQVPQQIAEQLNQLVAQAKDDNSPEAVVVIEEADRFFASPEKSTGQSLMGALTAWSGVALTRAAELSAVADYLGGL